MKTRRQANLDLLKRYFSDISGYRSLSAEEERDLAARVYATGDKKFTQKLILSNLKLVVTIALTCHNDNLDLLDLIQEGNLGLMQAVQKYDPLNGSRFSTYAFFCIRTRIMRHLTSVSALPGVNVTVNREKVSLDVTRAKRHVRGREGEPNPEDMAFVLAATGEDRPTTDNKISFQMSDGPSQDPQGSRGGFWPKENIEEIVAARERIEVLRETVMQFRKRLDERETYILEHRITAPERPMTLAEIGDHFRISRERVRQLETAILKKLKIKLRQTIVARTARIRNVPAA